MAHSLTIHAISFDYLLNDVKGNVTEYVYKALNIETRHSYVTMPCHVTCNRDSTALTVHSFAVLMCNLYSNVSKYSIHLIIYGDSPFNNYTLILCYSSVFCIIWYCKHLCMYCL